MHTVKTYSSAASISFCFLLYWSLSPSLLPGQTAIGGIINQYSQVTGVGNCSNSLQVTHPERFTVGQRVLLISVQGADISLDNNSDFGKIAGGSLRAGIYNWTTITDINGNEILTEHFLSPGYDFSQAVQLVSVPTYEDAVVTSELLPQAWDGATGGVVALEVTGTLDLQANVDASGAGFRGAESVQATDDVCNLTSSFSRYFYEQGNWRGAPKGEGIVPPIAGMENGRGPQANGGGGSNSHNAGGGGGANRTNGGGGGRNEEPSFGGCDGFFPGFGGRGIGTIDDRWIMGGGGGAGHTNNNSPSSGGNGGGIVLVQADNLIFSGGEIRADGLDGEPGEGDGAGGGGAGGTIVLSVNSISGPVVLNARGGKGGDVNNRNANRCMGPGGGGSGGLVYSSLDLPVAPDLSGGEVGLSMNSTSCPAGPNGALAGEAGLLEIRALKDQQTGSVIEILGITADTMICPGEGLQLSAAVEENNLQVIYQWQTLVDGEWIALSEGGNYSGTQTKGLQIAELTEDAQFQLVANSEGGCSGAITSDLVEVLVADAATGPISDFSYELDGLTVALTNNSKGATAYEWKIQEIPVYQSTDAEPELTFPTFGTYEVLLIARGGCFADTSSQLIAIGGSPIAAFEGSSSGNNCVPLTVQWTDKSQGVYDTYLWEFPGGKPAVSTDANPVVVYTTPGQYDVSLTVTGELGSSTYSREKIVKAFSVPQPEFSYQVDELTVYFSSIGNPNLQHVWSFGDGVISQEKDPVHTFSEPGAYDVTLNLQNGGCGRSITYTLLAFPTGITENGLELHVRLFPNPTYGPVQLESNTPALFPLNVQVFNSNGQQIDQKRLISNGLIDLESHAAGIYWILIRSPLGTGTWKVIKP